MRFQVHSGKPQLGSSVCMVQGRTSVYTPHGHGIDSDDGILFVARASIQYQRQSVSILQTKRAQLLPSKSFRGYQNKGKLRVIRRSPGLSAGTALPTLCLLQYEQEYALAGLPV